MVILSPRFVLLACICAALPLAHPAPVEAAHLYRHDPIEKHPSGSHSHERSPNDSPTRSYDGKYHAHKVPEHRVPELPPLLRRHDDKVGDYHSQDSHESAPPKPPRSAFARSRYHRDPAPYSRRSSIYVSGEYGNTYLVSRTQPRTWGSARRNTDRQSFVFSRRRADENNLVLGRIDIMGAAPSADGTQRLASLTVDSAPIDWTSGQSPAKAFTLNASTTNQTQFIMLPTEDASNSPGSFIRHISLATEVFDASSAEMVMYCATYDSDPGSSSLLLMTPCTGASQSMAPVHDASDPCSGAANLASSSNAHQSQIFSYDPTSGKIEPISAAVSSAGTDDSSPDLSGCAGARIKRDIANSTMSGSSNTLTSTPRLTSASQQAQNVTLMYVVGALEVPASSPSASNAASTSMGQVPLFTTTITTTVVSTVKATGSANRTGTPAQAAVSVSMSSTSSPAMPQSTTAISAPPVVPPVAPLRSSSTLSLPSSTLAAATSKTPASAAESLEVEIVGVKPSMAASSSLTSSTTTTMVTKPTITMTSSNSSMRPSLDAQAVASSIANAVTHPRGRVFRSGAIKVNPP